MFCLDVIFFDGYICLCICACSTSRSSSPKSSQSPHRLPPSSLLVIVRSHVKDISHKRFPSYPVNDYTLSSKGKHDTVCTDRIESRFYPSGYAVSFFLSSLFPLSVVISIVIYIRNFCGKKEMTKPTLQALVVLLYLVAP